ncbi:MAG: hypothetical protein WC934_06190 [Acidithiobacillus sp.]|jgi:hypothetical protein|uniref:hypothetical protein n=1 Tax=Acidithiobacillus sp. TaxID=1872118 RepID=UPI003560027C
MSEFYYKETPEIENAVKNFCKKTMKYVERQSKLNKPTELKIPVGSTQGDHYVIEVNSCGYGPNDYEIRFKEKLRLKKPNEDGQKELGGGEMWIQKDQFHVDDNKNPLTYVFASSFRHWDFVMDKLGLEGKLQFVPKDKRKYK